MINLAISIKRAINLSIYKWRLSGQVRQILSCMQYVDRLHQKIAPDVDLERFIDEHLPIYDRYTACELDWMRKEIEYLHGKIEELEHGI